MARRRRLTEEEKKRIVAGEELWREWGLFEVSSRGRVKQHGKIVEPDERGLFVFYTGTRDFRLRKSISINRLVLGAFLPKKNTRGYVAVRKDPSKPPDIRNLRWKRGRPRQKLTQKQVDEIRELLEQGVSQRKLAAAYGVSQPTISDIKNRRLWA